MEVTFRELISKRRQELGLRQQDVALGVGISSTYVTQMEKGEKIPSLSILVGLAKVLQVPEVELLKVALHDKAPGSVKAFFGAPVEKEPGGLLAEDLDASLREMLRWFRTQESVRRELVAFFEVMKRKDEVTRSGNFSAGLVAFQEDADMPKPTEEERRVLETIDSLYRERTTKWLYKAILEDLRTDALFRTTRGRKKGGPLSRAARS